MNTAYKKFIKIGIIVVGDIVLFYYIGIAKYLSIANIKAQSSSLQQQLHENYFGTVIAFLALWSTLIAFTLPVTGPMGIIGGFLFGLWPSTLYCMICITIGTTLSFLVIRHALSQIVRSQYKAQLENFNDRVRQYGYGYLITLQLLTVVPYFVINTLAALANVPLPTFMWTTALGSLPVIMIYSFAGRELAHITSWGDILSVHMLALLVMLAALAMLPMIVRKIRNTDDW